MYGDAPINEQALKYMNDAFTTTNPTTLIQQIRLSEENSNDTLQDFQKKYPNTLNSENVNDILENLQRKQQPKSREKRLADLQQDSMLQKYNAAQKEDSKNDWDYGE